MKSLIASLVLASVNPAVEPVKDRTIYCDQLSQAAKSIMAARQSGVRMQDSLMAVQQYREQAGFYLIINLIDLAYNRPQKDDQVSRNQATSAFKVETYTACMGNGYTADLD